MSFTLRNAAVALALLAAAVATWLLGRPGLSPEPGRAGGAPAQLGYYLNDAVLLGTDERGRVVFRIHAGHAEEDPQSRSLALQAVRVEYRESQEIEWQVSARRATAPGDVAFLELEGDVRLSTRSGAGADPAVVETEQLHLEPRRGLATSAAPVSISAAGLSLRGRGLRADLREDRLQLEADVRGRFYP